MEKDLKIFLFFLAIIMSIIAIIVYPFVGGAVTSLYFIICLYVLLMK